MEKGKRWEWKIFMKSKINEKMTKRETGDKERCILILYNEFHQKYNYRDDIFIV